ncbi:MAG TPA: thiamine pyrophosphate-binding protein, partial [Nitrososphaerales archaeon]|nr:thiamine pyrophosphate-binding protein [Nitrososphaerales archaeon]
MDGKPGKTTFEVKTGGHWLIRLLKEKGVDFAFGTSGAGMPDIQDAMVVEKPPKWIQGLHEFATVCAATGYSLASGRPGIAMIDRMVGTQNAVGAFYAASLTSAPLVAIVTANSAGIPMETGEEEYHFARNQVQFIGPWLKWSTEVNSLETLAEDIEKALHMAVSERQGPTYVSVRQDLMAKKIQSGYSLNRDIPYSSPTTPDSETVERIAKSLLEHKRPQIVAANIGRHPSDVPILVELAHLLGCGVSIKRDFMNYPHKDPLFLGVIRFPGLPKLMEGTDVVLGLELGLLPHSTLPDSVEVIDITGDPTRRQEVHHGGDYGSGLYPAAIRATADLGPTVKAILNMAKEMVHGHESQIEERRSFATALHTKQVEEWHRKADQSYRSGKLDGWSIGHVLNRKLGGGIRWMDGTFSFSEALTSSVEIDEPGTYFANPSSYLGVSPGLAYGVALADRHYVDVELKGSYAVGRMSEPKNPAVCTLGDGDAICGNIDSALWTCQHYGIGILYLVLNNACWAAEWGSLARSTQHWTANSHDYECLDIDSPRIDFASIAKGFSVHAQTVE